MFQSFIGRARGTSIPPPPGPTIGAAAVPAQQPTPPGSPVPIPQGSPYANSQMASSQASLVSNKNPLLRGAVRRVMNINLKAAASSQTSLASPPARPRGPLAGVSYFEDPNPTPLKEAEALNVNEGRVGGGGNESRLAEELTSAKQQLAEVAAQRSALQERINSLEEEVREREAQKKRAEEVASEEKVELISRHTIEMEAQRQEIQDIQQSLAALKRESGEMVLENSALHREIVGLKERGKQDEVRIEAMGKELDAAKSAMRDLEDQTRASLAESVKDRRKLVDQVDQLRRQLKASEGQTTERDEQIRQLLATEERTMDTLRRVEAAVHEKNAIVEDLQLQNRQLTEEIGLSQRRIVKMEEGHKELELQMRLAEEAANEKNVKLSQAHTAEMEVLGRKNRDLQRSEDASKSESKERGKKIETMARERDVLRQEITLLTDRTQKGDAEVEMLRREAEATKIALRELNDKMTTSLSKLDEEREKLASQAGELLHQLEDSQRASKEAERRSASLEKENERLQSRIVEKESEMIEAQNVAHETLTRSKEDHQQEMADAKGRIQSLLDEVSSNATVMTELRSSLAGQSSAFEAAAKLAEERGTETTRLQQNLFALRETLAARDQDLTESTASRLAQESQLCDTIRTLRERIVTIEDRARLQISRLEDKLRFAREKVRELQTLYESSEKTCATLRERLTAHETSSGGMWASFWKWYYGQSKQNGI